MIGLLEGKVRKVDERSLIVFASGVGYKVFCPLPALISTEKNKDITLYIHTHVREDAITLYGFKSDLELEIFERLIDVSGIGPKSALAMISVHTPASIANAVENGEVEVLSHTPGIGKKTAEKIIIELKGKLSHLKTQEKNEATIEVRLALEALGYSAKEIHEVVGKLNPLQQNSSLLIKEALRHLK